ncbi:hypothetical protein, partial [Bacteroides stercoris]|uniref:hypothetical protein n=1 Tax=Bacteroides stercoris TaxID=46506 RepID=UPI001C8C2A6C
LCHSEILMPKDTESLGNNKAPACESRGFVRKIMKVCILTHLLVYYMARVCHIDGTVGNYRILFYFFF